MGVRPNSLDDYFHLSWTGIRMRVMEVAWMKAGHILAVVQEALIGPFLVDFALLKQIPWLSVPAQAGLFIRELLNLLSCVHSMQASDFDRICSSVALKVVILMHELWLGRVFVLFLAEKSFPPLLIA